MQWLHLLSQLAWQFLKNIPQAVVVTPLAVRAMQIAESASDEHGVPLKGVDKLALAMDLIGQGIKRVNEVYAEDSKAKAKADPLQRVDDKPLIDPAVVGDALSAAVSRTVDTANTLYGGIQAMGERSRPHTGYDDPRRI